MRFSPLKIFNKQYDRVYLRSLSHEKLDNIFQGPFKPGLFCDSAKFLWPKDVYSFPIFSDEFRIDQSGNIVDITF